MEAIALTSRRIPLLRAAMLGGILVAVETASSASATRPGDGAVARPWQVANARERVLWSQDGRRDYRIFTATVGEAPAGGYPVIYILDANGVFGSLLDEVRRQQDATYKASALLVGIGYPGEVPWNDLRRDLDLTPRLPEGRVARGPGGKPLPPTGGADEFLAFILEVVKPVVESEYAVDRRRQTLAGHSFGGLFTLHAYLTRHDAFQRYVAMSPSVWFGDGFILTQVPKLQAGGAARPAGSLAPLLVTAGSCEQTPGECDPAMPRNALRDDWLTRQTRMVDRARELVAQLNALPGGGAPAQLYIVENEHHISVIGASIGRLVRFALSPGQP